MDYTKLPRQLIYNERRSLEDFAEEHEELESLIDNIISNKYFGSADGKERVLCCFNTAYYLCTLILICGKHAEWNFAKYCDIAYCNDNKNKVYQAFTLSLVYIFLTHNYYEIPCKKLIEKLNSYIVSGTHFLKLGDPFLNDDYYYLDACNDLQKNLPNDWLLAEAFKPRTIDYDIYHDVDKYDTTWSKLTDFYRRGVVEEIVNAVGKDETEKHILIDLIKRDAERFYGSDGPAYTQQAKPLLDDIDHEIYLQYNYEVDQTIEDDNSEQNHYLELKPFNEALFDSLINDIARLQEVNQEKEKLKARIAELEEENKRLAEQHGNQAMATDDNAVENLQKDLEHYKSMSETYQDIINRYEDELGPLERLDDWKEQLTIKERIIFFQALTGCSLKGVDKKVKQASQTTKAKLIARFSGNNPSKIRSVINQLSQEIEKVENKNGKFSQGTLAAARNVYNYLHLAVEGATIGSKPHHCQIAMQTIDQTYHLNIDRAVAPPKDDNFLIEQEPKNK